MTLASAPVRVLLVEDHETLRSVVGRLLRARPELELVGECADGMTALRELRRTAVDVVVMDFHMPNMTGADVVSAMRARGDETPVLMVSGSADEESIAEALNAGAWGYVVKRADMIELRDAILAAARGDPVGAPHSMSSGGERV